MSDNSTNARRVIFLNRFYWPDEPASAQMLTDLTRAIAARGYRVSVITSRPRSPNIPASETCKGVKVHRVRGTRCGNRNLVGRGIDFVTFSFGAFWQLLWRTKEGDTVVAMTDPPLLGVIAWFAAGLRGARVIHWVQDIYPEVATEITGYRSPLLLRSLRNFTWRRASACIVPGTDMASSVNATQLAAEKLIVSANWAPAGLETASHANIAAFRTRWNLAGKFVAMYSGNLGRAHDLEPLLEVASALRDDPDFVLVFVGDGARRESLEKSVRTRALTNVLFLPHQSREDLAASLGAGDVHFVTLRLGVEKWVYPSKLYGITKIGRPVLFIGAEQSEIAQCVRRTGIGVVFDRDHTTSIVAALLRIRADSSHRRELSAAALAFHARGYEDATDLWCRILGPELAAPVNAL